MALTCIKGTIAAPASTGNQTISLPSNADPKAIVMWTTGQTADARLNADGRLSIGFATYRGAVVQQSYHTGFSADNGAASACAYGSGTGSVCKLFSTSAAVVALNVTLVSMSTGATSNVVLNFATTLSGAVIHYLILGGSDVTDALVSSFTPGTAVATQDVTVVAGFGQPDLLLLHSNSHTAGDAGSNHPIHTVAFAKSDTERWCSCFGETSASATMTCAATQRARALIGFAGVATTLDYECDLSAKASWPADGFQVTYTDQASVNARPAYFLALKGSFTSTIADVTIPTAAAPQTQNLTLASGTPAGAIFAHWPGPTQAAGVIDTTHADLGGFFLGATDGTNEGACGWTEDDNNATAATGVTHTTTKAFQGITADSTVTNAPILNSECDSSISGSDVVLTWGDTDTVARAYGYVLLGSAPVAATQIPDIIMAPPR